MVHAIHASLIAHEAAHKAGVLHRDISAGNIMIVDEGNPNIEHGMLIDWDHSKMVEPVTGARQHARAGTWQFMAAELIQHPETPQTFIHDLESAFWVLIWVVVSYMPTNMDAGKRSNFLKDIMSPKVYDKSSSGLEKVNFLWSREVPTVPGVENIGFLLSELIKLFAFRYPVVETTTPSDVKLASLMEAMDAKAADINMNTADDADNAGDKDPNEERECR